MSDGLSDAHAVGELATNVQLACDKLIKAIQRAEAGHRGLSIDAIETANEILEPFGYRLQKRTQRERWKP